MKAAVLLAAAFGCFAAAYFFILPDFFSARAKPSAMEARAVRSLRNAAIPRAARERKNPIGMSSAVLAEGRAHFDDHCAICHGADGRGRTEMGPNFYPPVPDMTSDEIQSLSDGEIFYAIRNGVRFSGMPAWGAEHGDDDWADWKLVHFIRHLPNLTREEIDGAKHAEPPQPSGGHEHGHQHDQQGHER